VNPRQCILFFWPELERQVRLDGQVTGLAPEPADEFFATRPPGSRLAAASSHQRQPIVSQEELSAARSQSKPGVRMERFPLPVVAGSGKPPPRLFPSYAGAGSLDDNPVDAVRFARPGRAAWGAMASEAHCSAEAGERSE
jgi:hypothetical protein